MVILFYYSLTKLTKKVKPSKYLYEIVWGDTISELMSIYCIYFYSVSKVDNWGLYLCSSDLR